MWNTASSIYWYPGQIVSFTYDGSYWMMTDVFIDREVRSTTISNPTVQMNVKRIMGNSSTMTDVGTIMLNIKIPTSSLQFGPVNSAKYIIVTRGSGFNGTVNETLFKCGNMNERNVMNYTGTIFYPGNSYVFEKNSATSYKILPKTSEFPPEYYNITEKTFEIGSLSHRINVPVNNDSYRTVGYAYVPDMSSNVYLLPKTVYCALNYFYLEYYGGIIDGSGLGMYDIFNKNYFILNSNTNQIVYNNFIMYRYDNRYAYFLFRNEYLKNGFWNKEVTNVFSSIKLYY